MGNYNFEDEEKNFGETRRLEDINKEVRKIEKIKKQRKPHPKKEEKVFGMSKTMAVIFIAVCVFIICCGIWVLGMILDVNKTDFGKKQNTTDILQESESDKFGFADKLDMAIVLEKKKSSIVVKDLDSGKSDEVSVNSDAVITGSNGGKLFFSDIKRGSLVEIKFDSIGRADEIRFPQGAWHYTSVSGVDIDDLRKTAEIDDNQYRYDEDTIFSYKDEDIEPGKIEISDIVTVYGKGNDILSLIVEKRHGNIVLKNTEKIENFGIKIDYADVEDVVNYSYPVSSGKHSVVITGSNIDAYVIEVDVEENQDTAIDLSRIADAVRIKFNVNISNYILYVNETPYPEGTGEIVVDKGVYDIRIEAENYVTYQTVADCSKNDIELNIMMEKSDIDSDVAGPPKTELNTGTEQTGFLTIYTNPGWAKLYINGEYVGVSPVMVKLDYGTYSIKAKDSDGNITEDSAVVTSPEVSIRLDF